MSKIIQQTVRLGELLLEFMSGVFTEWISRKGFIPGFIKFFG